MLEEANQLFPTSATSRSQPEHFLYDLVPLHSKRCIGKDQIPIKYRVSVFQFSKGVSFHIEHSQVIPRALLLSDLWLVPPNLKSKLKPRVLNKRMSDHVFRKGIIHNHDAAPNILFIAILVASLLILFRPYQLPLYDVDDLLTVIIHKRLLYNPNISLAMWSADFTKPTSTSRLNMTSPK